MIDGITYMPREGYINMYKSMYRIYIYTSTEDFNIFKEFFKIVLSANLCKSKEDQLFINEE